MRLVLGAKDIAEGFTGNRCDKILYHAKLGGQ